LWSFNFVSAIDSELKSGRPGVEEFGRSDLLWWASAVLGLIVTPAGLIGYAKGWPEVLLPSVWWAGLGASVWLVSCIGLLNRYSVITVRPKRGSRNTQVRARIEAYYKKGQELYVRLANDPTITDQDTRQLVAEAWVNPVTDYLRGTLGERKADYFLSIARGREPDEETVSRLGYQKARARERIVRRLERLRKISGGL
jgi:hypothetical protein